MKVRFIDRWDNKSVVNPTTHFYNKVMVNTTNEKNQKYNLLVLLTEKYCSSCIKYEIKNINRFYRKYPHSISIKFNSPNKIELEKFGAVFPYDYINNEYEIADTQTDITPPCSILYDSSKVIHSVYRSELSSHSKSDIFYNKMIYLFESVNNKPF